jgi:hypothetical protein
MTEKFARGRILERLKKYAKSLFIPLHLTQKQAFYWRQEQFSLILLASFTIWLHPRGSGPFSALN